MLRRVTFLGTLLFLPTVFATDLPVTTVAVDPSIPLVQIETESPATMSDFMRLNSVLRDIAQFCAEKSLIEDASASETGRFTDYFFTGKLGLNERLVIDRGQAEKARTPSFKTMSARYKKNDNCLAEQITKTRMPIPASPMDLTITVKFR